MTQTATTYEVPSDKVLERFKQSMDGKLAPDKATSDDGKPASGIVAGTADAVDKTLETGKEGAAIAGHALTHPGEVVDGAKKAAGGFKDFMKKHGGPGKPIGGILGAALALALGPIMGGGVGGTILTVSLFFPFVMIFSDIVGGWINDKMGYGNSTTVATSPGTEVAKDKGVAAAPETQQQKQTEVATKENVAPQPSANSNAQVPMTEQELNSALAKAAVSFTPIKEAANTTLPPKLANPAIASRTL